MVLDRWLTDRGRAALRARLIRFDRALLPSEISGGPPERNIAEGTTQVSVVDRWGNAVALSQTVGGFFGATVATPGLGFLYNANLNAFNTTNPSSPHYLRPGQVPMTTLAPTIILKDGKPLLVLGGAGSDRVVPTIAAVISGFADPAWTRAQRWPAHAQFGELTGATPEPSSNLLERSHRRKSMPWKSRAFRTFSGSRSPLAGWTWRHLGAPTSCSSIRGPAYSMAWPTRGGQGLLRRPRLIEHRWHPGR